MHRTRIPPGQEARATPSAIAILSGRLRAALCDQGARLTWGDMHSHWLHARGCIEAAAEAADTAASDRMLSEAAFHLLHVSSQLDAMRTFEEGGAR